MLTVDRRGDQTCFRSSRTNKKSDVTYLVWCSFYHTNNKKELKNSRKFQEISEFHQKRAPILLMEEGASPGNGSEMADGPSAPTTPEKSGSTGSPHPTDHRKYRLMYNDMRSRYVELKKNCDEVTLALEKSTDETDQIIE